MRYKVLDTNVCLKCNVKPDFIVHKLWSCTAIQHFIRTILNGASEWTSRENNISMVDYLFGIDDFNCEGLNHFLLEAKIFIFYSYMENESTEINVTHFYAHIKKLIITEKTIALKSSKYDQFAEKWAPFIEIYNFHGPDAFGFL